MSNTLRCHRFLSFRVLLLIVSTEVKTLVGSGRNFAAIDVFVLNVIRFGLGCSSVWGLLVMISKPANW